MIKTYFVTVSWIDEKEPLCRKKSNRYAKIDFGRQDAYGLLMDLQADLFDKWSRLKDFSLDFAIEVPQDDS